MRSAIHELLATSRVLGLFLLLLAAPASSQSLGDIARQEQERKKNQPSHVTHVYDNDDLARPHILVPEDEQRVQAERQKSSPTSDEAPVETGDSEPKVNIPAPVRIPRVPHAPKTILPEPNLHSIARQARPDTTALARPTDSRPPAQASLTPPPSRVVHHQTEGVANRMHREEISGNGQIRVQPGDTLWKLAEKYLGDGKYWRKLASCNPQIADAMHLLVGMSVRLPEESAQFRMPEKILVEPGDSLWKLAQVHLGDGKDWTCLVQANPELQNSDLIFVGQKLTIPESCASAPLARVRHTTVSTKSSSG